jgi:hypothetical protein
MPKAKGFKKGDHPVPNTAGTLSFRKARKAKNYNNGASGAAPKTWWTFAPPGFRYSDGGGETKASAPKRGWSRTYA